MKDETFDVIQFFPTEHERYAYEYEYVRRHVPAEEATAAFKHYTSSVGARLGTTARVIITDSGDHICAEWQHGKGITFPPPSPWTGKPPH